MMPNARKPHATKALPHAQLSNFRGLCSLMTSPDVSGAEPTFYNLPVKHTSMEPCKSLKIKDVVSSTLYN